MVVTRNATTDSAWPISSNPSAKYNHPDRADCNLDIPLWKIVRASTAAPVFFPPEVVSWDDDDPEKSFVFVDGGTTPYNNPAFLLFRMATEPAYKLGWQTGEDKLLVVSVGTGSAPVIGDSAEDPATNLLEAAGNTLSALMSQASVDQDVNCRVIGRCSYGETIDRELEDLIPRELAEGDTGGAREKLFRYVRYNATLTGDGLAKLGLDRAKAASLRKMDKVDNIADLAAVGDAVGKEVDLGHLGGFVSGPPADPDPVGERGVEHAGGVEAAVRLEPRAPSGIEGADARRRACCTGPSAGGRRTPPARCSYSCEQLVAVARVGDEDQLDHHRRRARASSRRRPPTARRTAARSARCGSGRARRTRRRPRGSGRPCAGARRPRRARPSSIE